MHAQAFAQCQDGQGWRQSPGFWDYRAIADIQVFDLGLQIRIDHIIDLDGAAGMYSQIPGFENIAELGEELILQDLRFSDAGWHDLKVIAAEVQKFLGLVIEGLAREDAEVALSANADHSKIALYMPHAYDLALKMNLSGYLCQAIDLEAQRPTYPAVDTGTTSTVRLSMSNGDVLLVASK